MAADDELFVFGPSMDEIRNNVKDYVQQTAGDTLSQYNANPTIAGSNTSTAASAKQQAMSEVISATGIAGLEQARDLLHNIDKTYNDVLETNKAYVDVLKQQTAEMTEQNKLLAERSKMQASQLEAATANASTDAQKADVAMQIAAKAVDAANKTATAIDKTTKEAEEDKKSGSKEVIEDTKAVQKPIAKMVAKPINRAAKADNNFNYIGTLNKLGLGRIAKSVQMFNSFGERIKAASDAFGQLGSVLGAGKVPSNAAVSAVIGGNTLEQMHVQAKSSLVANAANAINNIHSAKTALSAFSNTGSAAGAAAGNAAEGLASRSAGTAATVAGSGGGLLGKAGGLLGKLAMPLAVLGTLFGAWKMGTDLHYSDIQKGALQGGNNWTGLGYNAEDKWQDAQKFLGITNVSGADLDNYRKAASKTGFNLSSAQGKIAMDVQKWAKNNGISENAALQYAEAMIRAGKTTDAVTDSLQKLKDTAKNTGQDFETLMQVTTSVATKLSLLGVSAGAARDLVTGNQSAMRAAGYKDTASNAAAMMNNKQWLQFAQLTALAHGADMSYLYTPESTWQYIQKNHLQGQVLSRMNGLAGGLARSISTSNVGARNTAYALLKNWGMADYMNNDRAINNALSHAGTNLAGMNPMYSTGNAGLDVNLHVDAKPGLAEQLDFQGQGMMFNSLASKPTSIINRGDR